MLMQFISLVLNQLPNTWVINEQVVWIVSALEHLFGTSTSVLNTRVVFENQSAIWIPEWYFNTTTEVFNTKLRERSKGCLLSKSRILTDEIVRAVCLLINRIFDSWIPKWESLLSRNISRKYALPLRYSTTTYSSYKWRSNPNSFVSRCAALQQ